MRGRAGPGMCGRFRSGGCQSPCAQAATGKDRYTPTCLVPLASTTASRSRSHRSCLVAALLANHFERTSRQCRARRSRAGLLGGSGRPRRPAAACRRTAPQGIQLRATRRAGGPARGPATAPSQSQGCGLPRRWACDDASSSPGQARSAPSRQIRMSSTDPRSLLPRTPQGVAAAFSAAQESTFAHAPSLVSVAVRTFASPSAVSNHSPWARGEYTDEQSSRPLFGSP